MDAAGHPLLAPLLLLVLNQKPLPPAPENHLRFFQGRLS
jgi:hypothetical protein